MRQIKKLIISVTLLVTVLWLVKSLSDPLSDTYRLSRWHTETQFRFRAPTSTPTHRTSSTTGRKRPSLTDLTPTKHNGSKFSGNGEHLTGKITAIDRVIVVGKTKKDDTEWVVNDLADWQHAIYAVDDPEALLRVAKNKGKEANVYLQFIIDHYDELPQTMVFLHSHRDGYPKAWHTEFSNHSNVRTIRMLRTDVVQRNGYVNLRCNPRPGCPDEIRPSRGPSEKKRLPEEAFPDAWKAFFGDTDVPELIATPCCAQFAVSKEQVLQRPLGSYVRYHKWLMETDLPDDVSGRVMEYMWHIIFGKDPVHCPDMHQCYEDLYGTFV